MSGDPARFRCAAASVARDEPLIGTASTVRAYLLVEHPGPWGVDALRDAPMPDDVRRHLTVAARAARVRALLVRRHLRSARASGVRVFAAYADPSRPWLESAVLAGLDELVSLDLTALGAGRSAGLDPHPGPLFCVCTHGRHDACCAELGRPVAAALSRARPEETWEISHIGGDRFAANLLVLPHGLYHGRVDAPAALAVAGGVASGELSLDHLRGRSWLSMPVQVAELALRRQLGETRDAAVRTVRSRRVGEHVVADLEVGGATWQVQVSSRPGEPHRLTCRAQRDNAAPSYTVDAITRLR